MEVKGKIMGVNSVEQLWQTFSTTDGVKVSENLKKTKLGAIFAVAVTTAANLEQRKLTIWDTDNNKDLSALEMLNAIKAIRDENIKLNGNYKDKSVKVRDTDRYTGPTKTPVNNEAAETLAFNIFVNINEEEKFYDWTGKNGKKQLEERSKQVNETNTRDAEKSVRVMLRDLDNNEINTIFKTETGMETPAAFYEKQLAYNGDKLNDLFVASYKVTDANAKLTVKIGKITIKGTKEEILEQLAADGGISKEEQVAFIKAAVKAAQSSANKDKYKKADSDGNSAEEIEAYQKMAELGFYYGTTKKAQKGKAAVDAKVQNGEKDANATARRMLRTLDTSELNNIIKNSKQETISINMQQEETVTTPVDEPTEQAAEETPTTEQGNKVFPSIETPIVLNKLGLDIKLPESLGQLEAIDMVEENGITKIHLFDMQIIIIEKDKLILTGNKNKTTTVYEIKDGTVIEPPTEPPVAPKVEDESKTPVAPEPPAEPDSEIDPWDDTEYLMKN